MSWLKNILLIVLIGFFSCSEDDVRSNINRDKSITLEEVQQYYTGLGLTNNLNKSFGLSLNHENSNSVEIDWSGYRQGVLENIENGQSLDVPARIENSPLLSRIIFYKNTESVIEAKFVHWLWEVPFNQNSNFTGKVIITDLNKKPLEVYLLQDNRITEKYIFTTSSTTGITNKSSEPSGEDGDCNIDNGCIDLDEAIISSGKYVFEPFIDFDLGGSTNPGAIYHAGGGGGSGSANFIDGNGDCPEGYATNADGDCVVIELDEAVIEADPKTPCETANTLEANTDFIDKMSSLYQSALNDNFESGYLVYSNSVNDYGMHNYYGVQGNENAREIILPELGSNVVYSGFIHSHYNGALSIFSYHDLVALYTMYIGGNIQSPVENFVFGMVSASGTAYIIVIENETDFANFGDTVLMNADGFNFLGLVYPLNTNQNDNLNEQNFINALKHNNSGLRLLKTEAESLTNWGLVNSDNNNNVSSSDCP